MTPPAPLLQSSSTPQSSPGLASSSSAPLAVDRADSTRQRILRLVVEDGPVSVVELAEELDLTSAGVRRHMAALEDDGLIVAYAGHAIGHVRRGRPARRFVATRRGQAALSSAYSDLAAEAIRYLALVAGPDAVQEFAERRIQDLEERLGQHVEAAGDDLAARVDALAVGLAEAGYAATARPVPGGRAVQLCQGHCPVQAVAAQFPQLCEAETQLFSRLLGVHVQRLSTLANGGHVCTTHVPTSHVPTAHVPTVHVPTPVPVTISTTAVSTTGPTGTTSVRAVSDRPAAAETVEGTR